MTFGDPQGRERRQQRVLLRPERGFTEHNTASLQCPEAAARQRVERLPCLRLRGKQGSRGSLGPAMRRTKSRIKSLRSYRMHWDSLPDSANSGTRPSADSLRKGPRQKTSRGVKLRARGLILKPKMVLIPGPILVSKTVTLDNGLLKGGSIFAPRIGTQNVTSKLGDIEP